MYSTVLVLSAFIASVHLQRNDRNLCSTKTTCGQCIAVSSLCGWCQKVVYESDRCDLSSTHEANGCNSSHGLFDPDHVIVNTEDEKVRDVRVNDHGDQAVQIQPQRMTIKLRPNKPARFEVKFRQAENYPVDLYFLMDLSKSMEDDKEKTAKLGNTLADGMLELTNDVQFGFGSFVDKVTMPFTSTEPSKLKNPCDVGCAPPYSFKHLLSFTKDISAFTGNISAGEISGNLDAPEGGLDAMMQVAVCGKRIGWRDNSRKLLIYSSDDSFHTAGDGKLGGIVVPNDAQCHLSDSGDYTKSLAQDYPSVGQMRKIIGENKINVIFAISKYLSVYQEFSTFLEGSTVGKLDKDSSNIVDLVRDNYKKITSKVELKANHTEGLSINFRSSCLGSIVKDTSVCEGLKIGEEVTFEVAIETTECPDDPAFRWRNLTIGPVGLKDKLIVDLEIICECDCEKPGQAVENSERCSKGNGTYACGICSCNEGRKGQTCECGEPEIDSDDQEDHCRQQKSSLVCSGQGECVCGQCQCRRRTPRSQERFSGKFCQCDDYSCDQYNGMLCGGPTRGQCQCGQCICLPEYNGTSCDCEISPSHCIAPNGVKCNGQGDCVCGTCKCHKESRCYGERCEHCPSCVGNCNCNRDCVDCRLFKTEIYTPEECENKCGDIKITSVDILEETDNATTCQEKFSDDSGCTFKFSYYYGSDNTLHISAQKIKVCPEPVDLLPIILGTIAGVLAIGLVLLVIWKMVITAYDKMEYKRFKEEIDQTRWAAEQNPLYREAIQTYNNPMCDGPPAR